METTKAKGEISACNGNVAAAYGVLLSRPELIAIYPITPQTALVEKLAQFHADGLLDAEIVTVEGENSAIGAVAGASAAGARVFTATCGGGLDFMFDSYKLVGRIGLPVVMVNVNREDPPGVMCGEQDIMTVADCGWVHLHAENCQEILDSIIMAYKLAEEPGNLVPVTVCYDGWYLSYLTEGVEIPPQHEVERFIPKQSHLRPHLDFDHPLGFDAMLLPEEQTELRYRQQIILEGVKERVDRIDRDFEKSFGRGYGGQIEEYRTQDAEILLIALGSCVGTARLAVDNKRSEGIKVGLVKVRLFRPFPREKLVQSVTGKKAIGVIDRSVCFGWNCGHLFMESRAALYRSGVDAPVINFIDGLAGSDITIEHIERAIDMTYQASQGIPVKEVTWLTLE